MMTATELIARARAQIGQHTVYRLGGGKGTPTGEDPRDEAGSCDCSAFACWVLGLQKHQEQFAWLRRLNGGWFNTDGIWWDANRESTGYFNALSAPQLGAVIVYPSRRVSATTGPAIGHVGIVSDVRGTNVRRVIHCSSGNYRRDGDAIAETSPDGIFERSAATICAWCVSVL